MNQTYEQAQYNLINTKLGCVDKIETPIIQGAQKNVKIVTTPTNRYTFKFTTNLNLALKNMVVAAKLREYGIPVPDISVFEHNNLYAEVYPTIPGQTLYEYYNKRKFSYEVYSIYCDVIKYFEKMSRIRNFQDLDMHGFATPYNIAQHQLGHTNRGLLVPATLGMIAAMNVGTGSTKGLYHHGITPKNILVDSHGQIVAFIDLDEVSICNRNYAFGVMAAKALHLGVKPETLCETYNKYAGHTFRPGHIKFIAALNNFGRKKLWQQIQNQPTH